MSVRIAGVALFSSTIAACAAASGAAKEPATAPSDVQGAPNQTVEINRAKSELKQAEAELAAAQNNCASACKALASMERATEHLCGVVTPEEQRICEDARSKLASSRERVRTECGECSK